MLIFKIIGCIIIGIMFFYTYFQAQILQDLLEKATKEEKKAFEKIGTTYFFLSLFFIFFIAAL